MKKIFKKIKLNFNPMVNLYATVLSTPVQTERVKADQVNKTS